VLIADGVGQVAADARGDELEAVGGAVGEPRAEPVQSRQGPVAAACSGRAFLFGMSETGLSEVHRWAG
jgi:hypothetical protein